MGTWGRGTFENDGAKDWTWDLTESTDTSVLKSSLDCQLDGEGYLDAQYGEKILCAAEVILALQVRTYDKLPEEIAEWAREHADLDISELIPLAKEKGGLVLIEKSELLELWSENREDFLAWQKDVKRIVAALDT